MFVNKQPFKAPPGSTTSWEVRFPKGRKPFKVEQEARAFVAEQRALPDGWAELSRVISIVEDRK